MTQENVDRATVARIPAVREFPHGLHGMPILGPGGRLTYRNRTVCLSERNAVVVGVFIYHFGSELTDLELLDRVWPEGATRRTLQRQLRRLDRRLARVGLTIVDGGYRSHSLHPTESSEPCNQASLA